MKTKPTAPAPVTGAFDVTSLADLIAASGEPIYAVFSLGRKTCRMACRRLNEDEEELVRALRTAPLPPVLRGQKDGEDRYDYADPKYRAAQELAEKHARAMTIYLGCPELAALKPGLTSAADMYAFVRSVKLSTTVLEIIYLTIQAGDIGGNKETADRLNFISGGGSIPT